MQNSRQQQKSQPKQMKPTANRKNCENHSCIHETHHFDKTL